MKRAHVSSSLALALVAASTLAALLIAQLGTMPLAQAAGTISGAVFRDYDADGVRDAGEPGIGGVTVTVFDSAGAAQPSITSFDTLCLGAGNPVPTCTAANVPAIGTYSYSATGTGPYRVEFSGWSATFQPAAAGASNGTSVQFVPDGNSSDVNFALHNPAEYCQSNPNIAANCYTNGDPQLIGPGGDFDPGERPALVLVPYAPPTNGPADNLLRASGEQIGATWGLAYQREGRSIFAAAVLRRHSGFGPGGAGAIYQIDATGASAPSLLVDLNGPAYAAISGVPVGTITRNLTAAANAPNRDEAAFDGVGKVGLGGLAISDDERTLWVMNLTTRSLIELPIGLPAAAPDPAAVVAHPMPDPGCADGVFRPWAVEVQDGQVYIGGVCSGETAAPGAKNSDTSDLGAYIYRHDPAGPVGNFSLIFSTALTYQRGFVSQDASTTAFWKPWIDEWSDIGPPPAGWPTPDNGPFGQTMYPQPMLTSIAFDTDGSMVLGMLDRAGVQLGDENLSPVAGDAAFYEGVAAGDTVRVCRDPGAPSGYSLENNGACPGLTGSGVGNTQGPGNGEFFARDAYSNTHQEVTLGGLAFHRGRREVVSTAFDPLENGDFRSGGLRWFGTTNGNLSESYYVFGIDTLIGTNTFSRPGSMGKAAGLGDVVLLCDQAPIEVGNRVWLDIDRNGVQDPDEPALAGVQVELYRGAARVGVATTAADGTYYFRSGTAPTDADPNDNLINDGGIGIRPRTGTPGGASEYQVRIPNASGAGQQAALAGLFLTASDADPSPNGDSRDSDGASSGADAIYTIPYDDLAGAGYNNHTYDFGFYGLFSLGNRVWEDANNNGTIDAGEPGIGNVNVALFADANSDGNPDGPPLSSTTSDPNGYYRFDGLDGGGYLVEVTTPAGYTSSSNGQEPNPNSDGDSNDNGTVPAGATVRSGTITLGPGIDEPLGETDLSPTGQGAPDGLANMTVDFGFFLNYSLGNRVWEDPNNSGTIDAGELGIPSVPVNLFADADNNGVPDGAPIASTATDPGGYYRFDNLLASTYIVEVAIPAGLASSTNGQEPDPDSDGDSNDNGTVLAGANIRSAPVTLGPGAVEPPGEADLGPGDQGAPDAQANMTVDFGFFRPFSLGNRVWDDANNSGTIDGGELGLAGVAVNLLNAGGAPVAATTTGPNGYYRFDNLAAGTYIVEVVPPVGYASSTNGEEPNPDSDGDSNDNGTVPAGANIRSAPVTLGPYAAPTEPTGEADLGPGDQGAPDAQANMTVDFGFFRPFSLGNRVWDDANNSGTIDGSEAGIGGVSVSLLPDANNDGTPDGAAIATATTDPSGYYRFDNLLAGTYIVEVVPPAGYASSSNGEEADPDSDGDSNDNGTVPAGANIRSAPVTLGTNAAPAEPTGEADLSPTGQGAADTQANMTVDFGFFRAFSLGNRVWEDVNNSGTLDVGEAGLGGVTVSLYLDANADGIPDGAAIATTATNPSGYYRFDNLAAGTYVVEVVSPAGYASSSNGEEPSPNSDGDSNDNGTVPAGASVRSGPVTLGTSAAPAEPTGEGDLGPGDQGAPDAQANMTVDFGFFQNYSLGNRVWEDPNNNGAIDPGELGIAGITVNLLSGAGAPLATTTTDLSGYYRFDNLTAGTYIVEVVPPTGYGSSTNGEEPNPDSNVDRNDNGTVPAGANIRSGPVTLGPGAVEPTGESDLSVTGQGAPDARANMTVDFGFFRLLALGDLVWVDGNNNGLQGAGEPGVDGVAVELYRDTNASGSYEPATDTLAATTTTAGGGLYRFSGLQPGEYLVVLPAANFTGAGPLVSYTSSTGGGSEPAPDVDPDPDNFDDNGTVNGTLGAGGVIASQAITLASNNEPTDDGDTDANTNLSVDFGVFILGSIGDMVWYDTNTNGVRDAGENGVPGVTATLFRGDGTLVASTTTDGAGLYGFTGLVPGDYYVVFSGLPPGHVFSAQDQGGDDAADSDANTTTGRTITTTIDPGENDLTWDAGIYQLAGLGNYVWEDLDRDGVQDANETGVPNVTVNLLNNVGAVVATTTTDASGYYNFGGLAPASYQVEFVPPAGYQLTPVNQGGDDTLDSDAAPATGRSPLTPLAAGESNPTIDAGLFRLASLGNYVWEDVDRDGVQDGGEPGVPGVTVNLLDGGGVVIATTTTDAGGLYQFPNLTPGTPYQVEFELPAGYDFSPADQGLDDGADSDADRITGRAAVVILLSGENNLTLDAGINQPVALSLGNLVWNDQNNNGLVDGGEPGVALVPVALYSDANGDATPDGPALATATTDANGNYIFPGLTPGRYVVTITPPAGYTGSTGANGSATGPYEPGSPGDSDLNERDHGTAGGGVITSGSITLDNGAEPVNDGDSSPDSNLSIDFGIFQAASLGSFVWRDTNENGVFEPGEPPVAGVTVTLYNPLGGVIATTVTDANGTYQFGFLIPGTYVVGFSNLPPDTTFSPPNQGGNDSNDSDVSPSTGLSAPVALAAGQNNPTIWAGLIPAPPTAVTLRSFSASWDGKSVLVRWETGLELNTAGFHLLRSASGQRADAVRVTPALIAARGGSAEGASYSWRDAGVEPGASYTYWLEEVETSGARRVYGPASAGGAPSAARFQVMLPLLR